MKYTKLKITLLLTFIFALLFLHFYAPRFITEIDNPLVHLFRKSLPSKTIDPLKRELINIQSFDGTKLSAYFTFAKTDTVKGSILLLHGIRSRKEHFLAVSDSLAKKGYHAIALDSRAHGKSKGKHCTFGVKEKQDISHWITYLIEEKKVHPMLGIWGQSLGGAIALQSMGTDDRIKFGIVESTFADFRTITHDYIEFHLGFNFSPFTDYLVSRAGIIAEFDPDEAKPMNYCTNIKQPILLVHGTDDKRIKIENAYKNFKSLRSSQKKLLEIKGANHINVWKTGGKTYFDKVYSFLEQQSI